MKINFLNLKFLFIIALFLSFASCTDNEDNVSTTDNYTDATIEEFETNGHLGRNACFNLVYPITLEFPDGTTAEVANRLGLRARIFAWKVNNPDIEERPNIQLPYEVELQDGSIATVADREELRELVEDCDRGSRGSFRKCYRLIFPIAVNFEDGTSVVYENIPDLVMGLRAWKAANPDATERPELAFPYEVLLKDGTTATVTSEEEEQALLDSCGDHPRKRRCFRPVLPATIQYPDGSTTVANDKEELKNIFRTWKMENPDAEDHPTFTYPYDVKFRDGNTATVTSAEDLEALKEECE